MLTVNTMKEEIGKTLNLRVDALLISVEVIDAKSSYGRIRLLVKPIMGSGEQWVEESRLAL